MSHIKTRKHPRRIALSQPSLIGALATGLVLSMPALAADQPGADADSASHPAKTLDRIHVHGEKTYKEDIASSPKFTQPLQDTPQTIQVITSDLFNQQGATTLTEALRNSPGVGTFFAGENGSTATGDAVYMRGFDTSGSIFVDGIRDLGSVSRDVFNIDRIEVEKGPAGTDTGRSAPTGSINMSSKQAHLGNVTSGTASIGTDGQRRTSADWNQTLGATSALRINAMWQDSDVPGRDHVNNKRWGLAPSLAFGLGSDNRVYLNLYYVKQENIPDGYVPTIGLPGWTPQPGLEQLAGHPVDSGNFYGTRHDHDDVTSKMATLKFEHDFGDAVTLSNIARWGQTEQDYLLTAFMGTGTAANTGNIKWTDKNDLSTYTLARSLPTYKDQTNKIVTDQVNLRADFATGGIQHYLTTGLEFAREEQTAHGRATVTGTGWPAANLYDPDWNVDGLTWGRNGTGSAGKTTTYSAYLFDTLEFGESFLLTAGLRADHYKTEYDSRVVCGSRGAPACGSKPAGSIVTGFDGDHSDTLLNWKIGAVYKADDAVSLYANWAVSQQPPGGSNFALSDSVSSLDNPNMDPQKARTIEAGAKWAFLDDALAFNMALFKTEVTNEITGNANDGYFQNGRKSVQGAEFSVVGNITDNWLISAGYTHQQTSVDEGSAVTADGSNNLGYTPEDAFTSWTSYRFPFGLAIGGGVRYSGRMHRGTDGAVGTPAYAKSYTVYDAVASWDINRHFTLRLNGYNLFDKKYVASINKSGYRYTPGTPRTFLLSADFRF